MSESAKKKKGRKPQKREQAEGVPQEAGGGGPKVRVMEDLLEQLEALPGAENLERAIEEFRDELSTLIKDLEARCDELSRTVAHLEEEKLTLEASQAELDDRYLRLLAEFDNFRKRSRQEAALLREAGKAELTKEFLTVIDDLERMADHAGQETSPESLQEGVTLIGRKLRSLLAAEGIEVIDPKGESFDPNLHEAAGLEPTSDSELNHRVAEVYQKGYQMGDRLLRPARVRVYQLEEPKEAEPEDQHAEQTGGAGDPD